MMHRLLFAIGVIVPWAAVAIQSVRMLAHDELELLPWMPWAMLAFPLLALFVLVTRFSWWKFFGFGTTLLPLGVGAALVFAQGTPEYTGPLEVGKPLPEFRARGADGIEVTRADLVKRAPLLFVAFRGYW